MPLGEDPFPRGNASAPAALPRVHPPAHLRAPAHPHRFRHWQNLPGERLKPEAGSPLGEDSPMGDCPFPRGNASSPAAVGHNNQLGRARTSSSLLLRSRKVQAPPGETLTPGDCSTLGEDPSFGLAAPPRTPPQTPCSSRKHGRSFPSPAAPDRTDGAGGDSPTASTRSPR